MLQWTEATDEHIRSYVNGIPTGSGGTHETGLRAGIGKAVRNYIDTHNLSPKGVTLTAEDIREGLTGVLSAFVQEPQFQGQTKDRLNNPELVSAVDGVVRPGLEHWLNHNATVSNAIVGRIILAARAREASRAAQAEVSRKSATSSRHSWQCRRCSSFFESTAFTIRIGSWWARVSTHGSPTRRATACSSPWPRVSSPAWVH